MKKCVFLLCSIIVVYLNPITSADNVTLYPNLDNELTHDIDGGTTTVQADGQWWPNVMWRESPLNESQMVFEFDLSGLPGEQIIYAELHFYVESITAIDSLQLETWIYAGDGTITQADYDAGNNLAGLWNWQSPIPGSEQILTQQHVAVEVTTPLQDRETDLIGINLRLAGDNADGYDGNVFVSGYNEHRVQIAAVENAQIFRPALIITFMPPQDTNSWQMKQKDIHNSGRAAYTVPQDRLDDTFFDDILWQTPTTGAFDGSGFAYFDGAGPNGADIAVCTNTWPNRVTGVDRHSGKLFWQDSPGGGDAIGKLTPAFSNNGTTIYATTDSLADRSLAFSSLTGPAGGVWGNSGDADPTHLSMLSPTVAPDGRIFMHKWNEACYAGSDNGVVIAEVWAASEGVGICLSDTALYQDGDNLLVIQTGRAGRIMTFDGATGAELWRVQTNQGTDCSATVDPENGNIYYAAGLSGKLYVIGLDKNGNDLWSSSQLLLHDWESDPNRLERARSTGCLSHDGRTYYFQSTGEIDNGKLYAINTSDGSLKWSYDTHCKKDTSSDFSSAPIITQNSVLVLGNVLSGQYLAIKDVGDHAILIDSITMEPESNDPTKRQAKASPVISPDGKLYLPLRTYWTIDYEDGGTPDGSIKYCLAAFDLSGCDGYAPADFNQDCQVNLTDLAEFVSYWMECKRQPPELCLE